MRSTHTLFVFAIIPIASIGILFLGGCSQVPSPQNNKALSPTIIAPPANASFAASTTTNAHTSSTAPAIDDTPPQAVLDGLDVIASAMNYSTPDADDVRMVEIDSTLFYATTLIQGERRAAATRPAPTTSLYLPPGRSEYSMAPAPPRHRSPPGIDVWAISLNTTAPLAFPQITRFYDDVHRQVFHLGDHKGYAWFTYCSPHRYLEISNSLHLPNATSPISTLVAAMTSGDRDTAMSCQWVLKDYLPEALPDLSAAVQRKSPNWDCIVTGIGWSRHPAATQCLRKLAISTNHAAKSARWYLLMVPRAEATDLYVQWLKEDIGRTSVFNELQACHEVKAGGAEPLLESILRNPASLDEYVLALDYQRDMPVSLAEAERAIYRCGDPLRHEYDAQVMAKAVNRFVTWDNSGYSAAIALKLILHRTKGPTPAITSAGWDILRAIPQKHTVPVIRLLASSSRDAEQQKQLAAILAELTRGPTTAPAAPPP